MGYLALQVAAPPCSWPKSLCKGFGNHRVAKMFTEVPSSEDTALSSEAEKRIDKNYDIQLKRLKNFVETNPKSIWADDAQYILATLIPEKYPEQSAPEYEYLLETYPNMALEEWTKTNLPWIRPSDIHIVVRFSLMMAYKRLGEKDKLKQLVDETIKKQITDHLYWDR